MFKPVVPSRMTVELPHQTLEFVATDGGWECVSIEAKPDAFTPGSYDGQQFDHGKIEALRKEGRQLRKSEFQRFFLDVTRQWREKYDQPSAMAKVEFTPVWLTRDEDGMPTPEEEQREPLFSLLCRVARHDVRWLAWVEGHDELRYFARSMAVAVGSLPSVVIPRFPQINSIDTDARTMRRDSSGEIVSMAFYLSDRPLPRETCPECRGSGRYVGLSVIELCRHCDGLQQVLALPLPR